MDNFKILLQSAISRKSSQSTYCQKITVLFAVSAVLHSFEWGGSPIYIGIFSSIFVSCVQTDNKIAESIRIWTVGRLSSDYIYFIRLFRYFRSLRNINRFSLKIENDESSHLNIEMQLFFQLIVKSKPKTQLFFFLFLSLGLENPSVKLRSTFNRPSIEQFNSSINSDFFIIRPKIYSVHLSSINFTIFDISYSNRLSAAN